MPIPSAPFESIVLSECADSRVERIQAFGGLLRKTYQVHPFVLWRTLWRASRAEREFENLTELRRAGLRCVRPVHWTEQRQAGCVLWSQLYTEFVDDAPNLQAARERQRAPRVLRAWSRDMGTLLRQLHAAGFCSTTASPRNVLVDPRSAALVWCDQPHAAPFGHGRVAMMARGVDLHDAFFSRSRRREGSRPQRWAGVVAYCNGDLKLARQLWRRLSGHADWSMRLRRQLSRMLSPLFRRRMRK